MVTGGFEELSEDKIYPSLAASQVDMSKKTKKSLKNIQGEVSTAPILLHITSY